MTLDFSFLTWGLLSSYVLKGLIFSIQLTLVAMVGGIALGTVIALMRLSGKPWLAVPAAACLLACVHAAIDWTVVPASNDELSSAPLGCTCVDGDAR